VKLDISTKNNMGGNLQSFAFHTAQEAWRQNLLVQKRMPLSNAYSHVSLASAISRRNIIDLSHSYQ